VPPFKKVITLSPTLSKITRSSVSSLSISAAENWGLFNPPVHGYFRVRPACVTGILVCFSKRYWLKEKSGDRNKKAKKRFFFISRILGDR
jgi:hypothetical protein